MRVFVLGKLGAITHWTESAVAGFRAAGHEVRFGVTRDPRLHAALDRLLLARWLGAPRAARLRAAVARFAPDLILAIDPFNIPPAILDAVAGLPGRAPLAGWVGDRFDEPARAAAAALDLVAYVDSGFLARHHALGFPRPAIWLPHAAETHAAAVPARPEERRPRLVFVGNPSPHRVALLGRLTHPVELHGPAWQPFAAVPHAIHRGRVGRAELADLYRTHLGALNMRDERNLLHGLNQRNFEPALFGTPIVTEDRPDLARCFDPGREVLAWRDAEELDAIHARLRADPAHAAAIGEAGRRRVLAEHGYGHRLATLAAAGGMRR